MEIKKDMTVELFDSELYLTKCYDTSYTAEQMKNTLTKTNMHWMNLMRIQRNSYMNLLRKI